MRKKAPLGGWFRQRAYPHFDFAYGSTSFQRVKKLVSDPSFVARHDFYPFISYDRIKYKIIEDEERDVRYLDDKGIRTLCYAAHLDSHVYAYYSYQIGKIYEKELVTHGLADSVTAFRKLADGDGVPKSNIHFARDAFKKINDIGACRAYAFDIEKFFDSIDAGVLKEQWQNLINEKRLPADHFNIFKSMTAHSVVDRTQLYSKLGHSSKKVNLDRICEAQIFREKVRAGEKFIDSKTGFTHRGLIVTKNKGIPQGSPISGLIANIYMLDFDKKISKQMKAVGGCYYRYCDDVLCVVPASHDFDLEALVSDCLGDLKLSLNNKKTEVRKFIFTGSKLVANKGLQYLGFVFDGQRSLIRTSSISRFQRKLIAAVVSAKKAQVAANKRASKRGAPPSAMFKKRILENYSHAGDSNFITYGLRAADILNSKAIRLQVKKLSKTVQKILSES